MLRDVRNYKAEAKLAPNAPVKLTLSPKAPFPEISSYLSRFLFAKVEVGEDSAKGNSFVYGEYTLSIEEEIDPEEKKQKLLAEKEKIAFEVSRGEKILNNPGFLTKAPKEKIEVEKGKLAENKEKLSAIEKQLASL